MEIDTSTIMMILFSLSFGISMWKVYAFLPNKALADDDTTKESQEEILTIIKKHINKDMHSKELLELVKNDKNFDKEHFWRLNENKLNQLRKKIEIE